MNPRTAPTADWVTIAELHRDPFPIFERLRAEGGVHWVPAVGRYLITSYEAVHHTELDQETFSANEQGSLQIRAMGHSMLRRDDPEHYVERKAWEPALRPGVVKRVWQQVFHRNAERYLDEMQEKGPEADLIWDFAAPYAAENLREVLGFHNATQEDLQRWSQTMIDATGNYADDPEIWARGKQSYDEVDAALDEMLHWHAQHQEDNPAMIAQLLRLPEHTMPLERIRANMKMSIGGGLNEPRDAIGVAAWALLTHPEQRALVTADASRWMTVFDETIRWVAPIGLYSRQTARETELCGVALPAGARLGVCLLSANRDERVWDGADRFDIQRETRPHLAFGKGTHVCLGSWMARAEVAEVALPALFGRFPDMQLHPDRPANIAGWVFRGMTALPVTVTSGATEHAPTIVAPVSHSDVVRRIAIVGAGPSGSFTAQELRRNDPNCAIDIFDAQPVPFGLVRYGVAPDHQGTKSVVHQFDKTYSDANVRFIGNVRLGVDVTLDELHAAYDAVVAAIGMHEDVQLTIPGSNLPGVYGAGAFTRDVNSHPDAAPLPSLGAQVTIIGHGNVALDVARLLATEPAVGSDIDEAAIQHIAGEVRVVRLTGRSAPDAAKFDPVMVRELAALPGIEHVVYGAGEPGTETIHATPTAHSNAREEAVALLRAAATATGSARVRMEWWFETTPEEILGESAVTGIRLQSPAGTLDVPTNSVVTAIGFTRSDYSVLGLPGELTVASQENGRVRPGLYAAGWVRRGARGTIPQQREDARLLAPMILSDIADQPTPVSDAFEPPRNSLSFEHWRRIDASERAAAGPGRSRKKLRSREQLCEAAHDTSIVVPVTQVAGAAARLEMPVTVAYASESGGAQFVAEEIYEALVAGGSNDVRLLDLGDVQLNDFDVTRFWVILCSTYGDGELPTRVRGLVAGLAEDQPDLSGLEYAVFGLGDRSYEHTYSRGSEILAEALDRCGARRLGEYGRHDAGGAWPAREAGLAWCEGVCAELQGRVVTPARG